MNENPTLKVLSSMRAHGVRSLLMGGQACVFYGAAEFSRDVDFAILADSENLRRLRAALDDLSASVIAVPPFEQDLLHRGHAVHFRCGAPGVEGLRVDVMTNMRGVDPFPSLWERRTTLDLDGIQADLMSLPDLVRAKKTQCSKDWPMIQRLIEAHWFRHRDEPTSDRVEFWLRECRSPKILVDLALTHQTEAMRLARQRRAISAALRRDAVAVTKELEEERQAEAEADNQYWIPLRKELEQMRRSNPK